MNTGGYRMLHYRFNYLSKFSTINFYILRLIIIIPMIIIFFACVFCMYLKKSHNNVCGKLKRMQFKVNKVYSLIYSINKGFSYGSCPRCDTNCSCDLFSNCCRKSQRIGDVNSRKTLSTTKPIVNPPKPSIKIENEKPPSYEEFAKQNAVIQIEQTDGANPLPVLPAPVIKNI